MTAFIMQSLTGAVNAAGFVVKKIEDEVYGSFDKPSSGEKYTGEIIIKVRPIADEEAELEGIRVRKEK